MRVLVGILAGIIVAGCVSFDRLGNEDFDRYVEFCRETAMTPVGAEDPNNPMSKADWMVGAAEVEVVENFYLAKDGLHFVYNEYEIACYAAGPVEVVIDPKSLQPMVKPWPGD